MNETFSLDGSTGDHTTASVAPISAWRVWNGEYGRGEVVSLDRATDVAPLAGVRTKHTADL